MEPTVLFIQQWDETFDVGADTGAPEYDPIGLIVSSAAKAQGEMSGRTTIEGAAKRTAREIGDQLKVAFQKQGWI